MHEIRETKASGLWDQPGIDASLDIREQLDDGIINARA
jgi:hypothetical protein